MPIVRISDSDDERIADYRNVSDPELRRRAGVFIAENRLVVRQLLTSHRFRARSLLLSDAALAAMADAVAPLADALPVYVCPTALIESIAGFDIHRGCLAVGERPGHVAVGDLLVACSAARRLLVLEGITNADNMGGLFRTARAFHIGAVVLGPGCCDPLYRKAIRVSIGASLHVPFAQTDHWPGDLARVRREGYALAALTPARDALNLEDLVAAGAPPRLAIVAGNEGVGLTAGAEQQCDLRVRIPMAAGIDSINVTTAVAIAMYRLFPP